MKNSLTSTKLSNATEIQTSVGNSISSKTASLVWTSSRLRVKSLNSVFSSHLRLSRNPIAGQPISASNPCPILRRVFLRRTRSSDLKRSGRSQAERAQRLERELRDNRERHFHATTRSRKLACKRTDSKLRAELATELKGIGMPADDAEKLARWDPYSQNATASWFDPEWMFGVPDGYDVVIGNPPYVKEYTFRQAFDGLS